MKILSFSRLGLLGTLMVGLMVASSVATPKLISGESLTGGCDKCSKVTNPWCPDAGDEECVDRAYRCDRSGEKTCFTPPGPQSCVVDGACGNWRNQSCD